MAPTTDTSRRENIAAHSKALQQELRELVDVVGPANLADLLLERAFQLQATDVHLDPSENGLRIRLRIDGVLHDVLLLPKEMTAHMVSRVKLMANMDITERRLAQDGHIAAATLKHQRDVRVGSGPTIYGERLVLRLMPDARSFTQIEELGFLEEQLDQVHRILASPSGSLLSVGPVGSGKSTTLYACLEILNDPTRSLVTIEDPVERRIPGVNQIQVDPKIDFGFVEALRGVLRQDPNVMMIGEIRDSEAAHIACRAGLTGITVLSTIHGNDTAASIDVFREFGIPAMFIADSLQGLIAQRLVRKVCPDCRITTNPDPAECQFLGVDPAQASTVQLATGTGCDRCFHTGHRGRTGLFEVMVLDRELRMAILHGKGHAEIMALARSKGMLTLEDVAKRKILAGVTSISEIHRVLVSEPA
ncbi:MAG: type II/IV secretion system protein [Planctomycetaceae bacterium]|nr:type II/IV secretion system protein [Planctomycetaceae bacterium]